MKIKILMLLLATGIAATSCSSSKQTTTGSDTVTDVTDTATMGRDTIRTDTTGTTPRP